MRHIVRLRVRELLSERHITQKELAEMAHLREATISDIARGTRTVINLSHLAAICEALNVTDINELLSLEITNDE